MKQLLLLLAVVGSCIVTGCHSMTMRDYYQQEADRNKRIAAHNKVLSGYTQHLVEIKTDDKWTTVLEQPVATVKVIYCTDKSIDILYYRVDEDDEEDLGKWTTVVVPSYLNVKEVRVTVTSAYGIKVTRLYKCSL